MQKAPSRCERTTLAPSATQLSTSPNGGRRRRALRVSAPPLLSFFTSAARRSALPSRGGETK